MNRRWCVSAVVHYKKEQGAATMAVPAYAPIKGEAIRSNQYPV